MEVLDSFGKCNLGKVGSAFVVMVAGFLGLCDKCGFGFS